MTFKSLVGSQGSHFPTKTVAIIIFLKNNKKKSK
jgi:hypothetical protein